MKRKIDNLGRLVIPIEMRDELKIKNGDEVNIELQGNSIVIKNVKNIEIASYIKEIQLREDITTETYRVLENILKVIELYFGEW